MYSLCQGDTIMKCIYQGDEDVSIKVIKMGNVLSPSRWYKHELYLSRWWRCSTKVIKMGNVVSVKVIQTWIVFVKVMKMFYQSDKDGKCIVSVKVMQMGNVFLVYFCPIRPAAGFHSSSKAGGDVFVLPAAGTHLWPDAGRISLWRLDSGGERA